MSHADCDRRWARKPADVVACPVCQKSWQRTKRQRLGRVKGCSPPCRYVLRATWGDVRRLKVYRDLLLKQLLLRPEELRVILGVVMKARREGREADRALRERAQRKVAA